jgi:glycosyl transferase, family 25
MHAYVINLDRSADRRSHMIAELARTGIDYEFVRAVDGRQLDPATAAEMVAPAALASSWFRPGVLGGCLSRIHTYRKILADGRDLALVLEDDVNVPADLGELADAVGAQLSGAEIGLLSYDHRKTLLLSRHDAVSLPSGRKLGLPIGAHHLVSGCAYVITREACARYAARMLPLRARTDDWWHYYQEGFFDRLWCVMPVVVTKCGSFASTIDRRAPTSPRMLIREAAVRYRFEPVLRAIAFRRELIYRREVRVRLVDVPLAAEEPSSL